MTTQVRSSRWLTAPGRLLAGLAAALPMAFFLPASFRTLLRLLVAWDTFSLVYLGLCWTAIVRMSPDQARSAAEVVDVPHRMSLFLVLMAAITGFFSAVLMVHWGASAEANLSLLGLGTILLAWTLTHTIYGLHYMHLYYGSGHSASGLDFPGDERPDGQDFQYFSFTIGMTYQVSDVVINRRSLRRVVLRHALLSFAYATVIIALTINFIASRI